VFLYASASLYTTMLQQQTLVDTLYQQQLLVVDPLDTWLMLLAATLFASAVYLFFSLVKPLAEKEKLDRGFGAYYLAVGVYALATGVWATITWPFPGPYNIVLMDPWAIFGVACLVLGLSLLMRIELMYTSLGFAFLGIIPIAHGLGILTYRLTRTPELTFLMYFLTGLSVLLSPVFFYKKSKTLAYLAIAFLVVAGIIALFIGVNAVFGHIPGWGKWTPWYGAVRVGG